MFRLKAAILSLVVAMAATFPVAASDLPDAPKPKHEAVKFGVAATLFGASGAFQIWAQHEGARQCQAEDNRAGEGKLFGTADGFGRRPNDLRIYAIDGGILGAAVILEATHHTKLAKYVLAFGFTGQTATAASTYWYGCN